MAFNTPTQGRVFQINISQGGAPKLAVRQAQVTLLGLLGDAHRDMVHHGGEERALCLYSLERIQELQAEGHPIFPGSVGENLTLSGLDWEQITPGKRLRLGSQVELEVTRYTEPCNNIRESFLGQEFSRILQKKHPGWSRVYARVITTGEISVGNAITLV
jgi:MOSC domain-containing protein YiiM